MRRRRSTCCSSRRAAARPRRTSGLTAFAIAIRRLQGELGGREGRDGVAVLMRYTLRLLTLQQFQRAAALMCACELRRRRLYGKGETDEQRRWGATPMRIGLWVGQASTPNRTEDAEQWVKQARQRSGGVRGASPMQLARCPWCGSELQGGRDIEVDADRGRTILSCSDTSGQCAFTPRNSPDEGLPVVVVDEEVYRLLPALVIATVDKFARMPWEGRAQALFGQVSRHCERHGYLTPGEEHPGSHPKRRALPAVDRRRVRAAAPARSDHPGRAASDQRPARQPRRPVRDGGRRAVRLDGRRQAAAAEGDRVDRDDPPRRRSGRAAV